MSRPSSLDHRTILNSISSLIGRRRRQNQSENDITAHETRVAPVTQAQIVNHIPPASKLAVYSLMHLRLKSVKNDDLECTICAEGYKIDDNVSFLPCGHMFHSCCVIDWLNHRCTCPICRFEMPTEDHLFELGREVRMIERMPGRELPDDELAKKRAKTTISNLDLILNRSLNENKALLNNRTLSNNAFLDDSWNRCICDDLDEETESDQVNSFKIASTHYYNKMLESH